MKKHWIFVFLSLAMLFSLGFLLAPGSDQLTAPLAKPTGSAQATLFLTNETRHNLFIWLYGAKQHQTYSLYFSAKSGKTKSIKVTPDTYRIEIYYQDSVECKSMTKTVKIATKTRLKLTCIKSGHSD